MTTENTVSGDVNPDIASSGDTDAQLAAMQAEEKEVTTPEPEKVEQEEVEAKVKEEKVVPLAALHEERRARQELQRQMAERDRKQAERDAIIERRLAALTPQPPIPDPAVDGVGYLDHRLNEVTAAQRQILERDQQREQAQTQERLVAQLAQRVQLSEAEQIKATPDYQDALSHLDQVRIRELQVYGATPEQARAQAMQEKQQAALQWAHQGLNPAETAYQLALARGYTPKAAGQTAEQKVAAQQRGTAAAKSLGGGGAVNAGKLTVEALASMSDEEFSKLSDSQFRQAFGG